MIKRVTNKWNRDNSDDNNSHASLITMYIRDVGNTSASIFASRTRKNNKAQLNVTPSHPLLSPRLCRLSPSVPLSPHAPPLRVVSWLRPRPPWAACCPLARSLFPFSFVGREGSERWRQAWAGGTRPGGRFGCRGRGDRFLCFPAVSHGLAS